MNPILNAAAPAAFLLCLPLSALACEAHLAHADGLAHDGHAAHAPAVQGAADPADARTAALFAAAGAEADAGPGAEPHASARADGHAPLGVMGDHRHAAGEFMLSYRYMAMRMAGNRDGDERIDADTIATTVPNRFAGMPGMPPTLRVVPLDMDMEMHMLGAMYAPSDALTLMAMLPWLRKEMAHRTYQGGMGDTVLGTFVTEVEGLGDIKLGGLYEVPLVQGNAHFNLGLSLPTGSIEEEDQVLTPMNMRPTLRLPYPMQLGSGTYDLQPGFTWFDRKGQVGLGAQYQATIRLGRNDADYRLGHAQTLTAWTSWAFGPQVSSSLRLRYHEQGRIKGQDRRIMAPVQTADPDRQGGEWLDLGLGMNVALGGGHRLAAELLWPLHQDLNGPQMETDQTLIVGWQYAH